LTQHYLDAKLSAMSESEQKRKDIQVILECLGGLARRFHMHKHRKPMFGDATIGRAQIEVLMLLKHAETPPTMHEIASILRVTNGAVTQVIAPLLKKGLVTKTGDPKDKRVTRLTLSETASTLMHNAKQEYVRAITPAFATLTERDVHTLARILSKLSLSYDA
jgi:DNA-binding MarR family transcriptional regulator